jgi:ATP-binding cassette subfamily F protein uup
VATITLAMDGDGKVTTYAGGWSDYQAQKGEVIANGQPDKSVAKQSTKPEPAKENKAEGLTFTERHRLDELPDVIDRLTAEIAKLEEFLAQPDLYTKEPVKFAKGTEALVERQKALAAAEEEWMALEEKAAG